MAGSLKEIISMVQEELANFHLTDDFEITPKYLKELANKIRNTLLSEEIKNKGANAMYYQRVCCLEVICHRMGCTVDGQFVPSSSVIWEVKLPPLVMKAGDKAILYVGTDQFKTNWVKMSLAGWMSIEGNIWSSTLASYTQVGDTIWIKNAPTSDLKYICAILLLYDPVNACDWNDETSQYPVPDIYKLTMLMKQDILSTHGLPKDKQHDATDAGAPQIRQDNE
jgi:hypothetical protein